MKKYLVFILLILATLAQARSTVVIVGGAVPAAGGECEATPSISYTATPIDDYTAGYYTGQVITQSGTKSLCKIKAYQMHGWGATRTAYAKVWTLSDTSLDTLIGTSDSSSVPDGYNDITFNFSTSVEMTDSVSYAITVDDGGTSIRWAVKWNGGAGISGAAQTWNSSKTRTYDGYSYDRLIDIHYVE